MRIPVVSNRSVGARPASIPMRSTGGTADGGIGQAVGEAGAAASRGIESLGRDMKEAQEKRDREMKEAKAKADAARVAAAKADYEQRITARMYGTGGKATGGGSRQQAIDSAFNDVPVLDEMGHATGSVEQAPAPVPMSERQPGFMESRGLDAGEKHADTIDALQADREALAENLANDDQRRMFEIASRDMLENTRRQAMGHVAGEYERAAQASKVARVETGLTAIANSYADEKTAAKVTAGVEADIRALQISPEAGNAEIAAFQKRATETRLNQFIGAKNWAGASAVLAKDRDKLGDRAGHFEAIIGAVKMDVEAEHAANELIQNALQKNGRVDATMARDRLQAIPEGPFKDEVAKRLDHGLALEDKGWNRRVSNVYESALTQYLKGGTISKIDTRTKQWLIDEAPEEWLRLKRLSEADADHWRRLKEGKGDTPAQVDALISAKADIDERQDFYRGLGDKDFLRQPILEGLTPPQRKEIGNYWVSMRKRDPISDAEFNRVVTENIGEDPGGFESKLEEKAYRARMNSLRQEHLKNNQNKEPTFEDRERMHAKATRDITVDRWRVLPDTKKKAFLVKEAGPEGGPELGPTKAPGARKIEQYLLSPDKKQRVPVYDDGTKGEIEEVAR